MIKYPVFQRKKGMVHVDPAWASFALISFNLLIELPYKGVIFKLFFISVISLQFNPLIPGGNKKVTHT